LAKQKTAAPKNFEAAALNFVFETRRDYCSSGFGVALDSSEVELLFDFLVLLDEPEVLSPFVSSLDSEVGEA
jgi:hypothetical protein